MENVFELKIPKERVAILVGKKGSIRKRIERETESVLDIDSHEGIVTITGEDPVLLLTANDVVKAIARGFNPDIALQVLKHDTVFEIIELAAVSKNKNDLQRLKGRIIGEKGKSRRTIEELTETYISVYGKTASIIGSMEGVAICKKALTMLVNGSPHASVYHMLERERRKWKLENQI